MAAGNGASQTNIRADARPQLHSCGPGRYNLTTLTSRRTQALVLAVFLAIFLAFYPHAMEVAESCDTGECTQTSQQAHSVASTCLTVACAAVVLSSPYAAFAFAGSVGRRPTSDARPAQTYLSLEPQPPRLSPSW